MKPLCLFISCLVFSHFGFAQNINSPCNCPAPLLAKKAVTTFKLSSGVSIGLCGSKETDYMKGKVLYSEFTLSECGSTKVIKFWDAITICDLKVLKDTLFVNTVVDLPVGKNMTNKKIYWMIERIYPRKGRITRDSIVNRSIPKYTPTQIASVLKLYNNTPDQNSEKTAALLDKLLIAAISGSDRARYYLKNFQAKFSTLSGVIFEQYDDDWRMLKEWEGR